MAKTITQLDDAGALQNNNFFEVIQGGLSKKTTFQNLVESMDVGKNIGFALKPGEEIPIGKDSPCIMSIAYFTDFVLVISSFFSDSIHIIASAGVGLISGVQTDKKIVFYKKENGFGGVYLKNNTDAIVTGFTRVY